MRRTARILLYVLTLQCEEADRVRCLRREGAAKRYEIVGEWLHSALCSSCRHARKQVRLLDEALAEMRERVSDSTPKGEPVMSDEARRHLADLAQTAERRAKER